MNLSHAVRGPLAIGCLWILALLLCAWLYKPGLVNLVLLDDAINLEVVEALASGDSFVVDVIGENRSGPLGRPLSMASFVFDLHFLDAGVAGAKLTNLLLHLFTGTLVLLFSMEVFRALGISKSREMALMVGAMWLLAPLLISTVLYMVQRMAQLATLFTLLSLWCYLRWRREGQPPTLLSPWLLVCLLSIPLAVLSKENGLLAVPLIILIELAILQPRDLGSGGALEARLRLLGRCHWLALVLGAVSVIGYLLFNSEWLTNGYASRPFDAWQRVLTQSRVLWVYVAQLLWVDIHSLGIYQDGFVLSESLTNPGSTPFALTAWLLCLPLAIYLLFRPPLRSLGFGMLFYLVAHGMESTIFPLELFFEHRNYLPAVGIFIALVGGGHYLWTRWHWAGGWLFAAWLVILSHSVLATAVEVQFWSNGRLFHLEAANRHPNSVRANEGLAMQLADVGDLESALAYVRRAEQFGQSGQFLHDLRVALVYCRAGVGIPAEQFMQWRMEEPDFADRMTMENSYVLARILIDGRCQGTDLEQLAAHWGAQILAVERLRVAPKLFLSLAILENHLQRYERALVYVDALLERSPQESRALMMRLYFTGVLEMEEEHEKTLGLLRDIEERGLLNAQERYNLSLLAGESGQ